eukprot:CAMPEP_0170628928 /NCGR_PEP_ID=MMETSP0224-20130122/33009_1 /TAXON_ID=285029 /ORGANISM="Togula jolla, Strain CCCM 725" /LENGTH=85 /DNA_ID=CAMNT_0010956513 /DNA_START=513 /DNA_END=766 /DNA_ORIENTATION=+
MMSLQPSGVPSLAKSGSGEPGFFLASGALGATLGAAETSEASWDCKMECPKRHVAAARAYWRQCPCPWPGLWCFALAILVEGCGR